MYLRNVIPLIAILALFSTGCFKKPDKEKMALPANMPVLPIYSGVSSSFLSATGSCGGDTSIIFTYSSALTAANTIEIPCSGDAITAQLPVSAGTSNQVFNVQIIGKLQSKRANATVVTVNFNPVPQGSPGYAVTVGGGKATSASASTFSTIGEHPGPQKQTAAAAMSRSGLGGIIDP